MIEFIVIIFLICILFYVIKKIEKSKKQGKSERMQEKVQDISEIYHLKKSILTENEKKFNFALSQVIKNKYMICPKVSLKEIIGVKNLNKHYSYFGRIAQKTIDFIICERISHKVILGIELDDKSHKRWSRKRSDDVKTGVFQAVGLRLVRFESKKYYDKELIKEKLIPRGLEINKNDKNGFVGSTRTA